RLTASARPRPSLRGPARAADLSRAVPCEPETDNEERSVAIYPTPQPATILKDVTGRSSAPFGSAPRVALFEFQKPTPQMSIVRPTRFQRVTGLGHAAIPALAERIPARLRVRGERQSGFGMYAFMYCPVWML